MMDLSGCNISNEHDFNILVFVLLPIFYTFIIFVMLVLLFIHVIDADDDVRLLLLLLLSDTFNVLNKWILPSMFTYCLSQLLFDGSLISKLIVESTGDLIWGKGRGLVDYMTTLYIINIWFITNYICSFKNIN